MSEEVIDDDALKNLRGDKKWKYPYNVLNRCPICHHVIKKSRDIVCITYLRFVRHCVIQEAEEVICIQCGNEVVAVPYIRDIEENEFEEWYDFLSYLCGKREMGLLD